jgi:hypothetical protein
MICLIRPKNPSRRPARGQTRAEEPGAAPLVAPFRAAGPLGVGGGLRQVNAGAPGFSACSLVLLAAPRQAGSAVPPEADGSGDVMPTPPALHILSSGLPGSGHPLVLPPWAGPPVAYFRSLDGPAIRGRAAIGRCQGRQPSAPHLCSFSAPTRPLDCAVSREADGSDRKEQAHHCPRLSSRTEDGTDHQRYGDAAGSRRVGCGGWI